MKYIIFSPVVALIIVGTFLWYFAVRIFDTIRLKDIGDQLYRVERLIDRRPKYIGGLVVLISCIFWIILMITIFYYTL